MRVYLSGAHGSGKSTLARYISKQHKLPILTEVARKILSERELKIDNIRHDLDLVDEYQQEVLNRQIAEEKKQSSFVSDRSAIDALGYIAQHTRLLHTNIRSAELTTYVAGLKQPDVKVFFVRPTKATLKSDGVRETIVWDGVVAIDAIIKCLLELFAIPYIPIATESMQERVRLIDAVLS